MACSHKVRIVAEEIHAVAAGAQGVVVGRKVWQRPEDEAKALIAEMARVTREKYSRRW